MVVSVLLANSWYLVGRADPNPLGTRGNVAAAVVPGPLPGERTIDPNNGFINQAIGRSVAREVLAGRVPAWDANQGVGMPLLASPQSAALFPPTLLNRLTNGLFYESLLLELIAGLAAYALARRMRLGRTAAAVAGVAFALNGTLAWLQNGAMLPVAFLPLVLLGVEHAADRAEAGRRGGWAVLALALGLLAQSGFVETAYIGGFLVGGWTIWRCLTIDRARRRAFLAKLACGTGAGALLSAPLVLPFLDYLRVADVGGHAGALAEATYPLPALPTLLGLPYAYGPIFGYDDPGAHISAVWARVGGYVSAVVLVLALVGLFSSGRRGLRAVLGLFIAACLAKSFGPHLVVVGLNLIPGMRLVAFYRYMTPALSLAAVMLAALGVDQLVRGGLSRRDLLTVTGIAAAILWLAERLASTVAGTMAGPARALSWSFAGAGAVLLISVCLAVVPHADLRKIGLVTLVAVDAVINFAVPSFSAPRHIDVDTTTVGWLRAHVGVQRVYSFGPITPNYGAFFDLPLASATNVPMPKRWTAFLRRNFGSAFDPTTFAFDPTQQAAVMSRPDVLRDLAVSFVVVNHGSPLPPTLASELDLAHSDRLADVYRLRRTSGYFGTRGHECAIAPGGRTEVRVRCDRPTTLVRRELYFPGWTTTIDGRPRSIRPIDGMYQGLTVPAGTHVIRYRYATPYFGPGLALALLGLLWIGFAAFAPLLATRRYPRLP